MGKKGGIQTKGHFWMCAACLAQEREGTRDEVEPVLPSVTAGFLWGWETQSLGTWWSLFKASMALWL